MRLQRSNFNSSPQILYQHSSTMRKFLILVALCAACTAAPTPIDDNAGLTRPSPINPEVISDPKPADKIVLPESVQAHEALQHDEKKLKREAPATICAETHSVPAHDGAHQDDKKQKRESPSHGCQDAFVGAVEAHTLKGQLETAKPKRELVEKPEGVAAHESLQHNAHAHTPAHEDAKPHSVQAHEALQHDDKKPKREAPANICAETHSVQAHDGDHQDDKKQKRESAAHGCHAVEAHTLEAQVETAKPKRELVEKPDSVVAHESLQHNPQAHTPAHEHDHAKPESVQAHEALQHDDKKPKREATEKPAAVAAHESLQHNAHAHTPAHEDAKPHSVQAHEALQHDDKKPKREAPATICAETHSVQAHDGAHQDDKKQKRESPAHGCHAVEAHTLEAQVETAKPKRELVEKPDSVAAHESLQHNAHAHTPAHEHDQAKPQSVQAHEALQHDDKRPKRDLVEKPAGVAAHESLQHNAHAHSPAHEDAKPESVQAHEVLQHDDKKPKREATEKPAAVAAHESLQHDAHKDADKHDSPVVVPEVLAAHSEHADHHKVAGAVLRHQRDIPVPTQIKTTAAPKEEEKPSHESSEHLGSTTPHTPPHSPLRHHPVPVAELFNKPKSTAKPSSDSSEESKESKESKESQ